MKNIILFIITMCLGFMGYAQTTTYTAPGGSFTYIVPAGVISISFDVAGAAGGAFTQPGGQGGRVQGTLAVTPGETLYIYVGGVGGAYPTITGGVSSGGEDGGSGGSSDGGSGGGAASDIRTSITGGASSVASLSTRVVVGGGGGGADYDCSTQHAGGAADYPSGGAGSGDCGGTYAQGGTQTAGGAASSSGGTAGSFGVGGSGTNYGGGGGGGWYGGGGGYSGSGGGGSSYAGAGTSGVTYSSSPGTGGGYVSITVGSPMPPITGPSAVCLGSAMTLSDTASGGTWSSSATTIATVGSSSGIVTGVSTGTARITYTVGSSYTTRIVTVNANPTASPATPIFCVGNTDSLTASPAGGTWASSNISVATIGSPAVLQGISAGTANITYTLSTGCYATFMVTVNTTLPAAITGPAVVCAGSAITLSDVTPGGTWSCSPPTVATIGITGMLSGVSAGTATVTYDVTGCAVTTTIVVKALQIPQICVVDVDSATGKNLVVWDQFTVNDVAWFNVYRENSLSVFVKIDSQASNVFSTYLDTGSYPLLQSYSYQLTATDSCGSETPLDSSTIHTTVHLSANLGVGGVVNLIWNTYVGAPVTTQNIMRSAGGAPYVIIASVANTVTSYTDAAPPGGTLVYKINSLMAVTCSPSARISSGGYGIVSSNPVEIGTLGIRALVACPLIQIYPNPATDELTIKMDQNAYASFTITNSIGQEIMQQPLSAAQTQVNVSKLPAGVYYITFKGENGVEVRKFVKE